MKVLLIMPYNCDLIHAVSLPLGLISIGTYLKRNGHDVKICDLSVSHQKVQKVFDEYNPDIVGLCLATVKHLNGVINITEKLKKNGVPIVWGGTFCDMATPEILFECKDVDILSFCEGEETWLEIVTALENGNDFSSIKGIAYRAANGEIIKTPERDFIDLKALPPLDFSLVDVNAYGQYLYGCKNLMYVYLAKGCPSKCTFCANQVTHRCTYRRRSIDTFMAETKILVEQYGVDGLYFGDEVCFLNKQQLDELCSAFENSELDFKWGFQTRIGLLNEDDFERLYNCGCRWVDFGIESGNKEQLQIMKKTIPYEKIALTFEICSKLGIISLANFIIGLPGETQEQLNDTVELAKSISATQCSFFHYCISPNTEMGKKAIADGLVKHQIKKIGDYKKIDFFLSKTDNLSHINQKELNVIQSHFLWDALFKKDYNDETHNFDLLFKHVLTLFRRMSFLPFKDALVCLFETGFLFLRFFFDYYFHPRIKRKYGLK